MTDNLSYDTFLSYNAKDRDYVESIASSLQEEAGLAVFFDLWSIIPGDSWQEALEEGLAQASTCVIFFGKHGLGPWQRQEMRAALERRVEEEGFRVIPVILPDSENLSPGDLPSFLGQFSCLDLRRFSVEESISELVVGILGQNDQAEAVSRSAAERFALARDTALALIDKSEKVDSLYPWRAMRGSFSFWRAALILYLVCYYLFYLLFWWIGESFQYPTLGMFDHELPGDYFLSLGIFTVVGLVAGAVLALPWVWRRRKHYREALQRYRSILDKAEALHLISARNTSIHSVLRSSCPHCGESVGIALESANERSKRFLASMVCRYAFLAALVTSAALFLTETRTAATSSLLGAGLFLLFLKWPRLVSRSQCLVCGQESSRQISLASV